MSVLMYRPRHLGREAAQGLGLQAGPAHVAAQCPRDAAQRLPHTRGMVGYIYLLTGIWFYRSLCNHT